MRKRLFLVIPSKTFNWDKIKMYLLMKFFCINEVKHLHHNKCVENKSEMSWKYSKLSINVLIVFISVHMFESPTSYSTTNDSIFPFILRMSSKYGAIIGIYVFRNEFLSSKYKNHHNNNLENGLTKNVFEHCGWNDVLISWMWWSVQKFFSWRFSGKSQRSKCVHNKIDPQHLNWFQNLLFNQGGT